MRSGYSSQDRCPIRSTCGARLGVMICEGHVGAESGSAPARARRRAAGRAERLAFREGQAGARRRLAAERTAETGLPLIYVNLVGGQDELVFDGASFVWDPAAGLRARAPAWRTSITSVVFTRRAGGGWACQNTQITEDLDGLESVYYAMAVGLHDYVEKNRFRRRPRPFRRSTAR